MELHDEYVFLMSEEKTEYSMILEEGDGGRKYAVMCLRPCQEHSILQILRNEEKKALSYS